MANSLYDKGRQKFLDGDISWTNDNIKIALLDTDEYTVDLSTHEFLSDIPGAARVAISGNLASKTSTAGVANAAAVTLSTVSGARCEAVVIFKDSGNPTTSPLIAYIDTGTGLPITPNGGDILINWDTGLNKIFKL